MVASAISSFRMVPFAILALVMAESAIFTVVMAFALMSAARMVPSTILALVMALSVTMVASIPSASMSFLEIASFENGISASVRSSFE